MAFLVSTGLGEPTRLPGKRRTRYLCQDRSKSETAKRISHRPGSRRRHERSRHHSLPHCKGASGCDARLREPRDRIRDCLRPADSGILAASVRGWKEDPRRRLCSGGPIRLLRCGPGSRRPRPRPEKVGRTGPDLPRRFAPGIQGAPLRAADPNQHSEPTCPTLPTSPLRQLAHQPQGIPMEAPHLSIDRYRNQGRNLHGPGLLCRANRKSERDSHLVVHWPRAFRRSRMGGLPRKRWSLEHGRRQEWARKVSHRAGIRSADLATHHRLRVGRINERVPFLRKVRYRPSPVAVGRPQSRQ